MTLAWFLALGAEFDLVINLDGFNEIVLPYTDNVPEKIHPAYPRSWQLYSMKSLDTGQLELLARLRAISLQRNTWRRALATGTAGQSVFLLRALEAIDARAAVTAELTNTRLRAALNEEGHNFQTTGPFRGFRHDRALFRELVGIWSRSSLQMHALCAGNGIPYLHFLQPNQYVAGSKKFSPLEGSQMIRKGHYPPKTAVRAAYPLLARAGHRLAARGVAFHDLVPVFQQETRTVYKDSCCHFNALGIQTIANVIADRAGSALEGLSKVRERRAPKK
jgi:hypothetical protein